MNIVYWLTLQSSDVNVHLLSALNLQGASVGGNSAKTTKGGTING